jgi:hypothetical protein
MFWRWSVFPAEEFNIGHSIVVELFLRFAAGSARNEKLIAS